MSRRTPPPGQWFWLPRGSIDVIAEIGPTAFAVLAVIASHADANGRAFPSIYKMAARLRMDRRTVQRAVRTLIEKKLLMATGRYDEKRQTSHLYTLLPLASTATALPSPGAADEQPLGGMHATPLGVEMPPSPAANEQHEQEPVLTRTREQEKEPAPPQSVSIQESFAEWWTAYPKKAGKVEAKQAYTKALKAIAHDEEIVCDHPVAWLLARTKEFAASDKAKGQYCPYPATWLNGARYADDPDAWRDSSSHTPTQSQSQFQPKQFSEVE